MRTIAAAATVVTDVRLVSLAKTRLGGCWVGGGRGVVGAIFAPLGGAWVDGNVGRATVASFRLEGLWCGRRPGAR